MLAQKFEVQPNSKNPEERLTRQAGCYFVHATLNHSSLLINTLSKSYNLSNSIHYTPLCVETNTKTNTKFTFVNSHF